LERSTERPLRESPNAGRRERSRGKNLVSEKKKGMALSQKKKGEQRDFPGSGGSKPIGHFETKKNKILLGSGKGEAAAIGWTNGTRASYGAANFGKFGKREEDTFGLAGRERDNRMMPGRI